MKKITRTASMVAALMLAAGTGVYGAGEQNCQTTMIAASTTHAVSQESSVRGFTVWMILQTIIAEKMGVDYEEVKMESFFDSDLGADSLDMNDIIMQCEETFGIEIPQEVMGEFITVANLYDYIHDRVE